MSLLFTVQQGAVPHPGETLAPSHALKSFSLQTTTGEKNLCKFPELWFYVSLRPLFILFGFGPDSAVLGRGEGQCYAREHESPPCEACVQLTELPFWPSKPLSIPEISR